MPQVPYDPVPNVKLTDQPTPFLNVQTPGAAFGTTVASAVESMGGTMSRVGDELYTRAMALKDLDNHADADKAFQDLAQYEGDERARFGTLEGKARSDAYQQFRENVQKKRDELEAGLTPNAQKYYQSMSRNFTARSVAAGAVLAAQGYRQYQDEIIDGNIRAIKKKIEMDPWDDSAYQKGLDEAREAALAKGRNKGHMDPNDPYNQDLIAQTQSEVTRHRVDVAMDADPMKGTQLYGGIKGNLYGEDRRLMDSRVMGQMRATARENISDKIMADAFDRNGKQQVPEEEAVKRAEKESESLAPGDAILRNGTVSEVRRKYGAIRQEMHYDQLATETDLKQIIIDKKLRTEQQALADPEAKALIQKLADKDAKFNIEGFVQNRMDRLYKEANETVFNDTRAIREHDPERFATMDFSVLPINTAQMNRLEDERRNMLKQQGRGADAVYKRALNTVLDGRRAQAQALEITREGGGKGINFDSFAGNMWGAVEAWRTTHNRPPTDDEVLNKIAPEVLRSHTVPGFWSVFGTTNEVPTFKLNKEQLIHEYLEDKRGQVEQEQKMFPNATVEERLDAVRSRAFQESFTTRKEDKRP